MFCYIPLVFIYQGALMIHPRPSNGRIIISRILFVIGIFFFLFFPLQAADSPADMDSELARLRKEISRVQNDRRHNQEDMTKDAQEAAAYRTRTDTRFAQMRKQIDSISAQILTLALKRDSLGALITFAQSQRNQIDLSQEQIHSAILDACGKITALARIFPPLVAQQLVSSAELLSADITAKSVDNNESINRLAQILDRIEEATTSIQVSQESSPIPDIRGTVYRVRLGAVFEGVVDIKGEKAAVWNGFNSDKTLHWVMCDPAAAAELLKTAGIRDGKALPGFAMIPFMSDSLSGSKGGVR